VREASPEAVLDGLGGEPGVRRLVEVFYAGVADDPLLRPLYPEEDLSGAVDRLTWFLLQYWGGPPVYAQQRGHPRLRMRHAPFTLGRAERDAWLAHMRAAVDAAELAPDVEAALWGYLARAADALRNAPG
jgi:hemoglobin